MLAVALVGCGAACTTSEPSAAPCAPFALGAEVYADVGTLTNTRNTGARSVIVLDEQHASRVGQVELAIVLNRLHQTAGLRHVALEGSVVEKPQPTLDWFTSLPDQGIRRAVALQLLKQGEVGAAEFAAMVLPDVRLHAIEHEQEYQVGKSGVDDRGYTGYLTAIALKSMTADQIQQATALIDQGKNDEGIDFIIASNPWTSERGKLLQRKSPIVGSGEMRKLGTELEEKARQVGAEVGEYREDLRAAQEFFDAATRRSTTMADLATEVATRQGCAPIAMNVGAAHSAEVAESLARRDVSYSVVSPTNLTLDWVNGSLSREAFTRKLSGRSVDPAGAVGALLDGRRKPPPTSQQDWFKAKAQLAYATVVITRAAVAARSGGGGAKPPFNLTPGALGLGDEGPEAPRIAIDLTTVETVDDDVLFKATLRDRNADVWVKAGLTTPADDPSSSQTLEQALKQILEDLKKTAPATEPPAPAKPEAVPVIPGLNAAIATTKEDAITAVI
ncbi:hypothetical protein DFJ66_8110 [Saccharothrix variisporea]|uniref:Uncharacterized protein n=1 Tax=Saccharothrix variisporea TaxID=543527 RepID=A0A495XJN9_9PSEU|nr:hypothetical protein DFJ66_8110 [Saccharothrix variisporea]